MATILKAGSKSKTTKKCLVCKNNFTSWTYQNRKTCSQKCRSIFMSLKSRGKRQLMRAPIIRDGNVLVPLSNGKESLIDKNDIKRVGEYTWSYAGNGYAETTHWPKKMYLHHFIIGRPPKGFEVDHVNRNRLDNRSENLRFVTRSENQFNRGKYFKKGNSKMSKKAADVSLSKEKSHERKVVKL